MARGSNAKIEVMNKLKEAFGASYVGEFDKKVIVWADDGKEMVQIAIALTCPKTVYGSGEAPIGDNPAPAVTITNGGFDFSTPVPEPAAQVYEITPEEEAKIEELMKKFSL